MRVLDDLAVELANLAGPPASDVADHAGRVRAGPVEDGPHPTGDVGPEIDALGVGDAKALVDQSRHDRAGGRVEHFAHRAVRQRGYGVHRGVEHALGPDVWLDVVHRLGG
jgi:hypothetical protein